MENKSYSSCPSTVRRTLHNGHKAKICLTSNHLPIRRRKPSVTVKAEMRDHVIDVISSNLDLCMRPAQTSIWYVRQDRGNKCLADMFVYRLMLSEERNYRHDIHVYKTGSSSNNVKAIYSIEPYARRLSWINQWLWAVVRIFFQKIRHE